jgi:hypothetical protein
MGDSAFPKARAAPFDGSGPTQRLRTSLIVGSGLSVLLGVVAARLDVMLFGMTRMAVGCVRMVRRLLVIAGFMMLGGLAMVLGGMLVMFGGLVVVLDALMLAHVASPG